MGKPDRKKINELWNLYQSEHRIAPLCRATGLHHSTVTRYIKRGDLARGIEPFEARLKRMNDKADFDRAKEQVEDFKMISTVIRAAGRDLFRVEKKKGKVVIVGLKNDPTIADMDKLLRLKYFLAGEPDSRAEIKMNGEITRVIQATIQAVSKFVKDQETRNKIADELVSVINCGEGQSGAQESALPH